MNYLSEDIINNAFFINCNIHQMLAKSNFMKFSEGVISDIFVHWWNTDTSSTFVFAMHHTVSLLAKYIAPISRCNLQDKYLSRCRLRLFCLMQLYFLSAQYFYFLSMPIILGQMHSVTGTTAFSSLCFTVEEFDTLWSIAKYFLKLMSCLYRIGNYIMFKLTIIS